MSWNCRWLIHEHMVIGDAFKIRMMQPNNFRANPKFGPSVCPTQETASFHVCLVPGQASLEFIEKSLKIYMYWKIYQMRPHPQKSFLWFVHVGARTTCKGKDFFQDLIARFQRRKDHPREILLLGADFPCKMQLAQRIERMCHRTRIDRIDRHKPQPSRLSW